MQSCVKYDRFTDAFDVTELKVAYGMFDVGLSELSFNGEPIIPKEGHVAYDSDTFRLNNISLIAEKDGKVIGEYTGSGTVYRLYTEELLPG